MVGLLSFTPGADLAFTVIREGKGNCIYVKHQKYQPFVIVVIFKIPKAKFFSQLHWSGAESRYWLRVIFLGYFQVSSFAQNSLPLQWRWQGNFQVSWCWNGLCSCYLVWYYSVSFTELKYTTCYSDISFTKDCLFVVTWWRIFPLFPSHFLSWFGSSRILTASITWILTKTFKDAWGTLGQDTLEKYTHWKGESISSLSNGDNSIAYLTGMLRR